MFGWLKPRTKKNPVQMPVTAESSISVTFSLSLPPMSREVFEKVVPQVHQLIESLTLAQLKDPQKIAELEAQVKKIIGEAQQ